MKRFLLLLSLIIPLSSSAQQVRGIDFTEAILYDENYPQFEQLVKTVDGNSIIYFYLYRSTPIGLRHALEKTHEILMNNNGDPNKPLLDESYYSSDFDDLHNYDYSG